MSIRTILTGEDEPVLHKVCHPVTSFDQKLADLLDDMKETLAKANGVGLAAPQVGILRRAVIVVNDQDEMLELVNPEILPGFYMDKRSWIACLLDGQLPDELLRELAGESYRLVVAKLPKYIQRELAETT